MKILILIMAVFLFACGSMEKREDVGPERAFYERAMRALSDEEYGESQRFFKKLLEEYPTSKYLQSAYFNWGQAFEATNQFDEAAEKYKKLIEHYQGVQTREVAQAIYRLGICYEELGQDDKLVVSLLQLKPMLTFFPVEVAEAEWPARMAGAHARLDQLEQAKKYYTQAETGIKKLKTIKAKETRHWLPKTFFSMGRIPSNRMNFKTVPEFKTMMNFLEKTENWLMKSMETSVPPWNEKASAELIGSYNKAWDFINGLPLETKGDKLIAAQKRQTLQKELAVRLDAILLNLKNERDQQYANVSEKEDKVLFKFNNDLVDFQKRIDILISQREVQDEDTQESKKLKGPRIEGRLVP